MKTIKNNIMETKVNVKDLIGDLENFPIEVVEKMLQKQYKQIGEKNISVFQNNKNADNNYGGFHWGDTIEGLEFWNDVIRKENFDIFFERYPKVSKNVYIRGDVHGEEVIKELERRGGINKWDYTGNANGMLYFIDPVTNYISGAGKAEEAFQNLLMTYYTEISPCESENRIMVELTMQEIAEKLGVDVNLLKIKK